MDSGCSTPPGMLPEQKQPRQQPHALPPIWALAIQASPRTCHRAQGAVDGLPLSQTFTPGHTVGRNGATPAASTLQKKGAWDTPSAPQRSRNRRIAAHSTNQAPPWRQQRPSSGFGRRSARIPCKDSATVPHTTPQRLFLRCIAAIYRNTKFSFRMVRYSRSEFFLSARKSFHIKKYECNPLIYNMENICIMPHTRMLRRKQ